MTVITDMKGNAADVDSVDRALMVKMGGSSATDLNNMASDISDLKAQVSLMAENLAYLRHRDNYGLSTDDKSEAVPDPQEGYTFTELDTKDVYVYHDGNWVKL